MTKGEFKKAFRMVFTETVNREIEACPETSHVFSDEFDNRMSELFRKKTVSSRSMMKKEGRKAALIFLTLVLISFVIMEAPGIRATTLSWIRIIFSNVQTTDMEGKGEEAAFRYSAAYIPKGFSEEREKRNSDLTEQLYTDRSGNRITFVQVPKEASVEIDEQVKQMVRWAKITVGRERIVEIYELGKSWAFMWSEKGTVLMIRYEGSILRKDFSPKELIMMIESVKAVQE